MKAIPVNINRKFTKYLNQLIGNLWKIFFPIKLPKMKVGAKIRERDNASLEIWLWNPRAAINTTVVTKTTIIILARFTFIGSLPDIK